jgi:hypothetical protein
MSRMFCADQAQRPAHGQLRRGLARDDAASPNRSRTRTEAYGELSFTGSEGHGGL